MSCKNNGLLFTTPDIYRPDRQLQLSCDMSEERMGQA